MSVQMSAAQQLALASQYLLDSMHKDAPSQSGNRINFQNAAAFFTDRTGSQTAIREAIRTEVDKMVDVWTQNGIDPDKMSDRTSASSWLPAKMNVMWGTEAGRENFAELQRTNPALVMSMGLNVPARPYLQRTSVKARKVFGVAPANINDDLDIITFAGILPTPAAPGTVTVAGAPPGSTIMVKEWSESVTGRPAPAAGPPFPGDALERTLLYNANPVPKKPRTPLSVGQAPTFTLGANASAAFQGSTTTITMNVDTVYTLDRLPAPAANFRLSGTNPMDWTTAVSDMVVQDTNFTSPWMAGVTPLIINSTWVTDLITNQVWNGAAVANILTMQNGMTNDGMQAVADGQLNNNTAGKAGDEANANSNYMMTAIAIRYVNALMSELRL